MLKRLCPTLMPVPKFTLAFFESMGKIEGAGQSCSIAPWNDLPGNALAAQEVAFQTSTWTELNRHRAIFPLQEGTAETKHGVSNVLCVLARPNTHRLPGMASVSLCLAGLGQIKMKSGRVGDKCLENGTGTRINMPPASFCSLRTIYYTKSPKIWDSTQEATFCRNLGILARLICYSCISRLIRLCQTCVQKKHLLSACFEECLHSNGCSLLQWDGSPSICSLSTAKNCFRMPQVSERYRHLAIEVAWRATLSAHRTDAKQTLTSKGWFKEIPLHEGNLSVPDLASSNPSSPYVSPLVPSIQKYIERIAQTTHACPRKCFL